MQEGWVTTDEAMQIAGVSRTTLYILRLKGKIETTNVGRTVLYKQSDCEAVAREREETDERNRK